MHYSFVYQKITTDRNSLALRNLCFWNLAVGHLSHGVEWTKLVPLAPSAQATASHNLDWGTALQMPTRVRVSQGVLCICIYGGAWLRHLASNMWKYKSLPFSISYLLCLCLHLPWLVVVQLSSKQLPLMILFSHLKQVGGGVNKSFVCDLRVSYTLGTSGVSYNKHYNLKI